MHRVSGDYKFFVLVMFAIGVSVSVYILLSFITGYSEVYMVTCSLKFFSFDITRYLHLLPSESEVCQRDQSAPLWEVNRRNLPHFSQRIYFKFRFTADPPEPHLTVFAFSESFVLSSRKHKNVCPSDRNKKLEYC